MPLYDEPDDPNFARLEARFAWMPVVLEVEYGERETEDTVPAPLNWPQLLPDDPRYDLDEVECSLVYENPATGYAAAIWDASGEDDLPWAVFLADDYGVRLLEEYSLIDDGANEEALDALLERTATELPARLLAGEFDRTGEPVAVPEWLLAPPTEDPE